ncbi:hypothetical protein CFIO01_04149 [Colletotrichum fioriniae PJ7]|uniref:Uncharacterized protein n=1 Tax=Colletotrichum fioriniae PJ7 TaxID=1445577 RepID=A0A010QMK1_9PEZI|nr:hypothetical protein CFIO01_04149 [Colletotrichum fioriniae PJ7]
MYLANTPLAQARASAGSTTLARRGVPAALRVAVADAPGAGDDAVAAAGGGGGAGAEDVDGGSLLEGIGVAVGVGVGVRDGGCEGHCGERCEDEGGKAHFE